jgi:hypothetical protein
MKKVTLLLSLFIAVCFSLKAQDSLQQYVAKYKFPEGSAVTEVTVALENGALMVNSTMGNAALEKTGTDQFAMPAYNGTVVFTRNEAKKITGIKIDVMNITLEGTREESSGGSDYEKTRMPSRFPLPKMPGDY